MSPDMLPSDNKRSEENKNQAEINFCVYSRTAKNAKVPPFYLQKSFMKSAGKLLLIFLTAFIVGQYIMKSYLQKIDNDISSRLHIVKKDETPHASQPPKVESKVDTQHEAEVHSLKQLESLIEPTDSDFDLDF